MLQNPVCSIHVFSMDAGRFRQEYGGVEVELGWTGSPWGMVSVGITERGLCWLGFVDGNVEARQCEFGQELEARMPGVAIRDVGSAIGARLGDGWWARDLEHYGLWVRGTPFQVEVWGQLLKIPRGQTRTYGELAAGLGRARAARALGNAVGWNPVSLFIPCHRVLPGHGGLGGYRWGCGIKQAILRAEAGRPWEVI